MSGKCIVKGCCVSFSVIVVLIFTIAFPLWLSFFNPGSNTLTVYPATYYTVKCSVSDLSEWVFVDRFTIPSLQSFIQATATEVDKDLLLNGLAVYSNLANACQPLRDVSKAKIQVHRVALVTLTNNNCSLCPLENLILSAQNAGYSVLIYFADEPICPRLTTEDDLSEDKLLIPVLCVGGKGCEQFNASNRGFSTVDANSFLAESDRTNVEIRALPRRSLYFSALSEMKSYLENLYYWFLVGPVITLEWLRRTKKFCWMSGGQQEDRNLAVRSGTTEMRNMEEAANSNEEPRLNSATGETVENHHGTDDEGQPLLLPVNNAVCTRQTHRNIRYLNFIVQISHKIAVGFCYVVLVIAALPFGISSGGLSFFRFDEGYNPPPSYFHNLSFGESLGGVIVSQFLLLLPIYWSPFQILCFFLYSRFSCKATWAVQTNFSKLIRSDWFASNIYLLLLGIVVPTCYSFMSGVNVFTNATYDTACTVCNVLFIIILNKHKFVTRYVFYISVCMIFAYLESDVVAVFYFVLSAQGSLNNLKVTALRTAAIGLTLAISFNSSMHIIRKLVRPEESLFESLGEK